MFLEVLLGKVYHLEVSVLPQACFCILKFGMFDRVHSAVTLEVLIEDLLEPNQFLWLHSHHDVNTAIAVWARNKVHDAAEHDGRPADEGRPAPAEVHVGEAHPA